MRYTMCYVKFNTYVVLDMSEVGHPWLRGEERRGEENTI